MLRQAAVPTDDVLGIGVGVFGTVEQGREATVHAQTIGWEAVPLERMLRAGTALPIYLENGAKTLGQAELWFGAGRGVQHAVITLVGSGVGAAVITNGAISRGVTSSAGEWGHTCMVYDGRACRCGSRGCLEAYVGAEAVLDRWKAARGGRPVPGEDEADLAGRRCSPTAAGRPSGCWPRPPATSAPGWPTWSTCSTRSGSCWPAGPGTRSGAGCCRRSGRPRRSGPCATRSARRPSSSGQLGLDAVALGAATLPVADLLARGATRATPGRCLDAPA